MSSSASSSSPAHERGASACAGTASTATTTPPSTSPSPSLPASIPSVDFIDYLTQQKAALLQLFTSTQARDSPSATVTTAGPVPAPHRRCADAQARTDASVHHDPAKGGGTVHSANAPRCTPPQPSQRAASTSDADARHHADKNPLSGFLSYLALPGVYTEAQHMMEPMTPAAGPVAEALPHAAYASSSCSAATSVSASASQSTTTTSTNATGAAAASSTSSSCCTSSAAAPCSHVHQLRPTQFIMPVLCEVCKAAMLDVKVWPPPLPRQLSASPPASDGADGDGGGTAASAAAGPAAASPFSFFTFLASPATPALADAAPPPDVASSNASPPPPPPPPPPSRCTEPTHVPQTPPSSSAPTAAPSQPFPGFGTEGYRCGTCGIALHLQCLSKMRGTQACEVLAPLAHAMPSDAAGPTSDPAPSSSASSSSSSRGGSSGPFSWDRVRAMVANYLDPSDGAYSRRDGNVKAVLEGVFAVLDTVITRYPTLTPFTFVKRYPAMQELSTAHQTLYTACTASLRDTTLLRRITWADLQRHRRERTGAAAASPQAPPSAASAVLRPLRVDKSVLATIKASMTGASSSTSSGGGSIGNSIFSSSLFSKSVVTPMTGAAAGAAPRASGDESTEMGTARSDDAAAAAASEDGDDETGGLPCATSPVQLLLWNAMRYATAVYGEVYRRGSLSSTITATLLFTVNRSGVEVPKPVNDAAVTTLLDLPASSLRLSRWASQATEPSYALLVDDAAGRIVVAFRGTLNTFDIMTDLAAVGQAFCGGYAHQGAAEVVNTLFEQRASRYGDMVEARRRVQRTEVTSAGPEPKEAGVVDAVRDGDDEAPQSPFAAPDASAPSTSATATEVLLTPYVLQPLSAPDGLLDGLGELAAAYPTYSILITGHSLGGGVAVLFATRLHHDRALPESVLRRVHVIAFAPMPTLSLPAASCFDAASCAPEDGGYTSRPSHATATGAAAGAPATPAPACFPVWSVVNGFDCVPRLQVNTIDRLIRQIVGPQLASASAQPPTFLSASAPSSTAAAGAVETRRRAVRERRQRSEARDGAAGQTSPTEMTDMPALGHAEGGASCSVDSDVCNPPPPRGSDAANGTTSTSPTSIEAPAVGVEREVVVRARRPSAKARSRTSKLDAVSDASGKPVWPARDSHAPHDLSQELHHPGRVLLLTSPWDMSANRLVDVPRGHPVMHELFLMKSMLLQHMVDAYSGALGQINEGSAPRGA